MVIELTTLVQKLQHFVGSAEDFPEFNWGAVSALHRLWAFCYRETAQDRVTHLLMCRAVEEEVVDVTLLGAAVRAL